MFSSVLRRLWGKYMSTTVRRSHKEGGWVLKYVFVAEFSYIESLLTLGDYGTMQKKFVNDSRRVHDISRVTPGAKHS